MLANKTSMKNEHKEKTTEGPLKKKLTGDKGRKKDSLIVEVQREKKVGG